VGTAAIYLRSNKRDDDAIDRQRQACHAYAADRDIEVLAEFVDNGHGLNRPALAVLLHALTGGTPVGSVISTRLSARDLDPLILDRFFRDRYRVRRQRSVGEDEWAGIWEHRRTLLRVAVGSPPSKV
jgi:hypothetical protein